MRVESLLLIADDDGQYKTVKKPYATTKRPNPNSLSPFPKPICRPLDTL